MDIAQLAIHKEFSFFYWSAMLHCTEVKKGEINYLEILLFQASLGYF